MSGRVISGEREIRSADLNDMAYRIAGGFKALDVRQGDCVALMLRNDIAFFAASVAAGFLGAYATPINWHNKEAETGYILRDSGARILLIHADLLAQIGQAVPKNVQVIVVATPTEIANAYGATAPEENLPDGYLDFEHWQAAQVPVEEEEKLSPGSMIYTSGTTGHPKGVKREAATQGSLVYRKEWLTEAFGLVEGSPYVVLMNGPMYHSAPNTYGLTAFRHGGTVILQSKFDPEELLQLIEKYKVTHMHIVPTMFSRLMKLPADIRNSYDVSSLEFVVHGAAPCAIELKQAMIDWWGPVIKEYYGATETGIVVLATSEDALNRPGTVGRALKGREVGIYDDNGNSLKTGEIGEIFMNLPLKSDFTYHNQDSKRQEIEQNGLVTIGDVGYLDEDGYLFLCDRKNDMVISGGVNIYPAEIESVLIQLDTVKDCAVFGIPDDDFGESLCAHIEVEPGKNPDKVEIQAHLKQLLAGYKIPRVIEFCQSLPREDSGKIFKRKLRDPYWQQAGRNI